MTGKEETAVESKASQLNTGVPPACSSIRRILVGVDFSEASLAAVRIGSIFAKLFGGKITLLDVVDLGAKSSQASADCDALHAALSKEGFDHLNQIARDLNAAGIQAEVILRDGIPAEEIAKAGRDHDLILVGSNRPKRPWKLFRRRTVEGLLDNSPCPALVVPAAANH